MQPSGPQQHTKSHRLHDDAAGPNRAEPRKALEQCASRLTRGFLVIRGPGLTGVHQTLSARYSVIVFRVTEITSTTAISDIAITAPISKNRYDSPNALVVGCDIALMFPIASSTLNSVGLNL